MGEHVAGTSATTLSVPTTARTVWCSTHMYLCTGMCVLCPWYSHIPTSNSKNSRFRKLLSLLSSTIAESICSQLLMLPCVFYLLQLFLQVQTSANMLQETGLEMELDIALSLVR